jgi:hypothetical protein
MCSDEPKRAFAAVDETWGAEERLPEVPHRTYNSQYAPRRSLRR